MSTIFISHGISGHADENWFPWLKERLEEDGHTVIVPSFPHADEPQLQEWLDHFKQYKKYLNERSVFIGHSLGAAFVLRLLEKMQHPVRACFLVAAVYDVMGNVFDSRMTSFVEGGFDWNVLKGKAGKFYVIHSDNDPYVTLGKAEILAKALDAPLTLVEGAGHFNAAAGYREFAVLLEKVKAEVSGC